METLARVGISMKQAADRLTEGGVKQFAEAFDKLLAAVSKHTEKAAA
jgi:transaldolase